MKLLYLIIGASLIALFALFFGFKFASNGLEIEQKVIKWMVDNSAKWFKNPPTVSIFERLRDTKIADKSFATDALLFYPYLSLPKLLQQEWFTPPQKETLLGKIWDGSQIKVVLFSQVDNNEDSDALFVFNPDWSAKLTYALSRGKPEINYSAEQVKELPEWNKGLIISWFAFWPFKKDEAEKLKKDYFAKWELIELSENKNLIAFTNTIGSLNKPNWWALTVSQPKEKLKIPHSITIWGETWNLLHVWEELNESNAIQNLSTPISNGNKTATINLREENEVIVWSLTNKAIQCNVGYHENNDTCEKDEEIIYTIPWNIFHKWLLFDLDQAWETLTSQTKEGTGQTGLPNGRSTIKVIYKQNPIKKDVDVVVTHFAMHCNEGYYSYGKWCKPKPCDNPFSFAENWVTVITNACAKAWETYEWKGSNWYVAKDKDDIIKKIFRDKNDKEWNGEFKANRIVTSKVVDMNSLFQNRSNFNQDIANWDTSKVINMTVMFHNAQSFNQPLDKWNTSKVTNMAGMFAWVTSFNQPLNSWNTGNVTDMGWMFDRASSFNQPLNSWDTSNVTDMGAMFVGASVFNKPLNNWRTENVTDMSNMFAWATSFNQSLNDWNTSKVEDMSSMFQWATHFNQPINKWDTWQVENMTSFLQDATSFNQPILTWDLKSLEFVADIFTNATEFLKNQDIGLFCPDANIREQYKDYCHVVPDENGVTMIGVNATGGKTYQYGKKKFYILGDWNWGEILNKAIDGTWEYKCDQLISSNITGVAHLFDGKDLSKCDLTNWDTDQFYTVKYLFNGSKGIPNLKYWKTNSWRTTVAGWKHAFTGSDIAKDPNKAYCQWEEINAYRSRGSSSRHWLSSCN